MSKPLTFQEVIMRLHQFWMDQGCIMWQPYNIQVGAGTGNPATLLAVLGPEPWRVGYVEPSVRPDDGRYGENPNRMQLHYQYQVILKPDPGNRRWASTRASMTSALSRITGNRRHWGRGAWAGKYGLTARRSRSLHTSSRQVV